MRFLNVALSIVAALATLVSAQAPTDTTPPAPVATDSKDNQINYPVGGSIGTGSIVTIKWVPSTEGTITLVLRKGDGDNLGTIVTIASGTPNTGSHDWTPSSTLVSGNDYAIQIISAGGSSNYSPKFGIDPSITSTSSSSSDSASSTSSTTSSTISPSSSPSSSSSHIPTTTYSNSSSASASASATYSRNNTTESSSTHASPTRSTAPSATSSGASTSGGATKTNGAGQVASPLALIFLVVAGIIYLN